MKRTPRRSAGADSPLLAGPRSLHTPLPGSPKSKAASSALPVAPRRPIGYRAALPSGRAALFHPSTCPIFHVTKKSRYDPVAYKETRPESDRFDS